MTFRCEGENENLKLHKSLKRRVQYCIQHPAVKVNSVCRRNYWGSSVWIWKQQDRHWSYIPHSSNTRDKKGLQWSRASAVCRLQESLWFS